MRYADEQMNGEKVWKMVVVKLAKSDLKKMGFNDD